MTFGQVKSVIKRWIALTLCFFKHKPSIWGAQVLFNDAGCRMIRTCPRCNKITKVQEIDDSRLYDKEAIYVWNETFIKDYGITRVQFARLQKESR